jgi:hypothetical protein
VLGPSLDGRRSHLAGICGRGEEAFVRLRSYGRRSQRFFHELLYRG